MPVTFDADEAHQVALALAAVAAADGAMVAREKAFLTSFGYLWGISADTTLPRLDEAALARTVLTAEKRREVVGLCLAMALADRDYAPEESEIIGRIARALGVGDADLVLLTISARQARR
jgi:uncharacterized tellurite resistance protein B-like protein